MKKELNYETFGEIMNDFCTDNELCLFIKSPKGTQEVEIKDNHGCGATLNWFFLIMGIKQTAKQVLEEGGMPKKERKAFIKELCKMLEEDLIDELG